MDAAYAACTANSNLDLNAIRVDPSCRGPGIFIEDVGSSNLSPKANVKPAIPFVPFKITEFCRVHESGSCVARYSLPSEEFVSKDKDGQSFFSGTIGEYVEFLNEQEKIYNAVGYTLRSEMSDAADETMANSFEFPTSEREMKAQLLGALKLSNEYTLKSILGIDPKAECPKFPMPGVNNELPGFQFPRVRIKGVIDMRVDDIIKRFNEQQDLLCSLGFSFFDYIDVNSIQDPKVLIQKVLELKDKLIADLGMSEYAEYFNMETVQDVQNVINIAKSIQDLINAKGNPSPEQLFALRQQLNSVLPPDYKIPDIPNIPSPTPPSRMYLSLKKRKDWTGFNYGSKDRVGTYAHAYYEIRGSEDEQEATAFGAAGLYILTREINALGGYGYAFAGPSGVEGKLVFKVFGQDAFPPQEFKDSKQILAGDPNLWDWEFDQGYRSMFMVGPIPVTVTAGARTKVGVGYEYGIYSTQLKGTIYPYASASAYASGAAGIPKVLAVGAEADLTLIDAKLPISGFAGVKFDEVGYPYLKLGIDANANYEALKGRIYAYAEYLVPRAALPPWKKKKSTFDIFTWDGIRKSHRIMNWGMEIGRNATKISGELIDQTDRAESEELGKKLLLNDRKIELTDFQTRVGRKIDEVFTGINTELNSPKNLQLSNYKDFFKQQADNSQDKIDALHQSLQLVL
jgi:hypothetical protein